MPKPKAKPRYYHRLIVLYTRLTAPDGHVSYGEPSRATPAHFSRSDRMHLEALGYAEKWGFDGYRIGYGHVHNPSILTAAVIPIEKDENGMAIMPERNHRR